MHPLDHTLTRRRFLVIPPDVPDKYNREIRDIVAQPDIRDALANQGLHIKTGSREEFARMIKADTDKWGKVIREARITAD